MGGGAYAERIAVHERQLMAVPRLGGRGRRRRHPRGLDHRLRRARRAGRAHLRAHRARPRRRLGRRHRRHPDRQGDRRTGHRDRLGRQGRPLSRARRRRRGRLRAPRTSWPPPSSCTGGAGVDVVLDVIGGDYVERNIDALAVRGRIVQVGTMGGGAVSVNVGKLMPKRASLIGTVLRARPLEEKIAITRRFAAEMLPAVRRRAAAPGHRPPVPARPTSPTPTAPWRPTRTSARSSSTSRPA